MGVPEKNRMPRRRWPTGGGRESSLSNLDGMVSRRRVHIGFNLFSSSSLDIIP